MSSDVLTRAADAMVAEAERLEAMDKASTPAGWTFWSDNRGRRHVEGPLFILAILGQTRFSDEEGDMIVQRRNTLARDAATLRATAALCRSASAVRAWAAGDPVDASTARLMERAIAVAQAFLGENK